MKRLSLSLSRATKMKKISSLAQRTFIVLSAASLLLFSYQTVSADKLTPAQIQAFRLGINYVNTEPDAPQTQCGTSPGDAALIGRDNREKGWNFFKSKGLSDIVTAAIIGNLAWESAGLNPEIIQNGGESKNPADAGPLGWGIAQWTPGSKIIDAAAGLKITTPIYELGTQLNIVWGELQGTAPTGKQNVLAGLQQQKTLGDATEYYRVNYESGTDYSHRYEAAQQALADFAGGSATPSTTGSSAGGCSASSLSPDCAAAEGNAKILCAAKAYDAVSYSLSSAAGHQGGAEWHATCPTINASCYLDCSGLVNIAVYDAFGVDLREDTYAEARNTSDWQHISASDLQPGDLIQPNPDHVEIVDHVTGNTIYTFGAHSANYPQPRQVGPAQYSTSDVNLALRWVGK